MVGRQWLCQGAAAQGKVVHLLFDMQVPIRIVFEYEGRAEVVFDYSVCRLVLVNDGNTGVVVGS